MKVSYSPDGSWLPCSADSGWIFPKKDKRCASKNKKGPTFAEPFQLSYLLITIMRQLHRYTFSLEQLQPGVLQLLRFGKPKRLEYYEHHILQQIPD